jgi:hypothetical protein
MCSETEQFGVHFQDMLSSIRSLVRREPLHRWRLMLKQAVTCCRLPFALLKVAGKEMLLVRPLVRLPGLRVKDSKARYPIFFHLGSFCHWQEQAGSNDNGVLTTVR